MIVGIFSSGIAILLVLARMYSRYFITRAPGIDDLLVTISLVRGAACLRSECFADGILGLFCCLDRFHYHWKQRVGMLFRIVQPECPEESYTNRWSFRYGWGRHIWDVPPTKFTGTRLILWISQW
jgi:hypothetical protein